LFYLKALFKSLGEKVSRGVFFFQIFIFRYFSRVVFGEAKYYELFYLKALFKSLGEKVSRGVFFSS
jgi:hypothetical protein